MDLASFCWKLCPKIPCQTARTRVFVVVVVVVIVLPTRGTRRSGRGRRRGREGGEGALTRLRVAARDVSGRWTVMGNSRVRRVSRLEDARSLMFIS